MKNIKYISKIMQLGALFLSANALAGKTIDWQAQSTACSTAATNLGSADAIVSHICDGWNTSCGTSGYNQGKVYSCKAVVTPNGNGRYSVGTIVTVTQNGTSGSAGWPGGSGVLKDDEPEQHCPTQHPVKIARGEKYYYFQK